MEIDRKQFLIGAGAFAGTFAVAPLFAAGGRRVKTPLMLDTKRMAIHDGPGIRTTFFVKGCPLHCAWCHNPESISPEPQLARYQHLCKHCAKCTMDEMTCPGKALKLYGKPATIDELVAKALEDKAFYEESGGGVTISGGEPLFYWQWTLELLTKLKAAGLHTCVDTSLYAPTAAVEALMPVTDMWLPDLKLYDDGQHIRYTGVSNRIILRNLEMLAQAKKPLEVRLLVVPEISDGREITWRRDFLHRIGVTDSQIVELEYLDYARSKYAALGMKDTMPERKKKQ